MVVVLAQTKGGVGKSTLAVNFAVERSRAGRDVLLVDADEQATATDFTALRTEQLGVPSYTAVALSGPAVRTQVLQMRPKYGDIIIDASGRDTAGLRSGADRRRCRARAVPAAQLRPMDIEELRRRQHGRPRGRPFTFAH